MRLWRLTQAEHATLDGIGGMLASGRWHTKGRPLIYTASHLSLALVEQLVHRIQSPELLAKMKLVAIEIEAPDNSIGVQDTIPRDRSVSQQIGDEWLSSGKTLLLGVPSVVVPREANVIINPRHPRFGEIQVLSHEPFDIDRRFYERS